MPELTLMLKPASGLCNARCAYCFYHDVMNNRREQSCGMMADETLEAVLKKALLHAKKSCMVIYQGGEPTLCGLPFYHKAIKLQEKYNANGVSIQNVIQTNGLAIDDSWAAFFAENRFLVGISLDGIRKTHDANRIDHNGQGTFHRVMDAVAILKKHHVNFNVLTVVNQATSKDLRRIYEFYRKNQFHYQQYIPCLSPFGQEWGTQEYSLSVEDYAAFLNGLFDLWFEDWKRGGQPYIRFFENLIGRLLGVLMESCDQNGICGVQYTVEADGTVYPCDFYTLDGYRLGNLVHDGFPKLDRARKELGFIEGSLCRSPACGACEYLALCGGGCRRTRVISEDGAQRSVFCSAYRSFFDRCLPRLRGIAEEIRAFGF